MAQDGIIGNILQSDYHSVQSQVIAFLNTISTLSHLIWPSSSPESKLLFPYHIPYAWHAIYVLNIHWQEMNERVLHFIHALALPFIYLFDEMEDNLKRLKYALPHCSCGNQGAERSPLLAVYL
jgi:hypothetical protein